jgi:isoquinoline 1-oxidoreductase beta subunit
VIVYPTFLGGGFGRKIENDAISQVVRIARKAGRPVQLVWSREEDFAHDKFRPAARARLAARLTGKDLDSRIEALAARLAVQDLGTDVVKRNLPRIAGDHKPGGNAFEGMMRMPYAIPAVALEHVLIDVPVPVGFWRSVGHSYTAFMMESFMDELAEKAGLDPLAFRLIHLQDQPRHTNVLRTLSTMAGPPGGTANGDGSISGAGLALWESFGSIVAMLAEVVVKKDAPPKVIRLNIAADCGRVINPDSVKAQLESAALYGLTAALYGAVSFEDGEARQRNFDTYPLLDMASSPQVEIMLIESDAAPGGAGEIGTPPVAPAVANALVAAKQARHRKLPLLGPVV